MPRLGKQGSKMMVMSWNVMIGAYAERGDGSEANTFFQTMKKKYTWRTT